MWPVLKEEEHNVYDEQILNIDVIRNMSALRKGDWKIIGGNKIFETFYINHCKLVFIICIELTY